MWQTLKLTVWSLAAVLILAGCQDEDEAVTQQLPTSKQTETLAMAQEIVEITGEAIDLKVGAIVAPDDGDAIYIDGLEYWPDGLSGKRVTVSGRLVERQYVPQATVDETGAVSQGVSEGGDDAVLEDAEWSLAE